LLTCYAKDAGAAYGIAISCLGFLSLGKSKKADQGELMKGIIPAIMASVRGVYGLIIAILISIERKLLLIMNEVL